MHLLGTSVSVFLLLPLVLSCVSTKTKEEISRDYEYIIQHQLEHINLSIQTEVESCERKLVLQHYSPIHRITDVVCNRLSKVIDSKLRTELLNLMRDINVSLGCSCSSNQPDLSKTENLTLQKKKNFCRLKRLLMTIQKAYEEYNSAK